MRESSKRARTIAYIARCGARTRDTAQRHDAWRAIRIDPPETQPPESPSPALSSVLTKHRRLGDTPALGASASALVARSTTTQRTLDDAAATRTALNAALAAGWGPHIARSGAAITAEALSDTLAEQLLVEAQALAHLASGVSFDEPWRIDASGVPIAIAQRRGPPEQAAIAIGAPQDAHDAQGTPPEPPSNATRTQARSPWAESEQAPSPAALAVALDAWLGHREAREGQIETAARLLTGQTVLLCLTTAGGKSVAYQLAALAAPGPCLVVEPLVALIDDQARTLAHRHGITATATLHASLAAHERQRALEIVHGARPAFVLTTPEGLLTERMGRQLAQGDDMRFAMTVVDEAHCACEWGHDFRPDYLALGQRLDQLERPGAGRALLSATAAPAMRARLTTTLARAKARHHTVEPPIRTTRTELAVSTRATRAHEPLPGEWIERAMQQFADPDTGAGIVFCPTKGGRGEANVAACAARARRLWGRRRWRIVTGGTGTKARDAAADFLEGRADTVIATTAFGIGVDRTDVRWTLHAGLPMSPETLWQQVGRAGRDGNPARCIILAAPTETRKLGEFFARNTAADTADEHTMQAIADTIEKGSTGQGIVATTEPACSPARLRRTALAAIEGGLIASYTSIDSHHIRIIPGEGAFEPRVAERRCTARGIDSPRPRADEPPHRYAARAAMAIAHAAAERGLDARLHAVEAVIDIARRTEEVRERLEAWLERDPGANAWRTLAGTAPGSSAEQIAKAIADAHQAPCDPEQRADALSYAARNADPLGLALARALERPASHAHTLARDDDPRLEPLVHALAIRLGPHVLAPLANAWGTARRRPWPGGARREWATAYTLAKLTETLTP